MAPTRTGRDGIAAACAVSAFAACAALSAMAMPGPGPGAAQEPGPRESVDIRQEINDHFVGRLPYGWWISIPEERLSAFHVTVHIPDWWRGNPTAAVMDLCPDRRSRIWSVTKRLDLTAFYRKQPWPGFECRP
ncbi:hypothetical protein [Arenibaculum pallidiluteum]|uniref:hypothetical protein n=1 Tax=Arenibaculum pallidiluteum TaxID=2812559 RepID=UPI001A977078|nr:hypothetical protein [Arenibaculum pallidiluteum]